MYRYFRVPLDRAEELQAAIDGGTHFAGRVDIEGWAWKTAIVLVHDEPADGFLLYFFFDAAPDDTILHE